MRWNETEYRSWGGVIPAHGRLARPERQSALAALQGENPCPAFGNRRSYGDACLNSGGEATDMTRLDRILSFDPETGELVAEAGIRIGEIARIMAPKGWLPRVMPGTGFATLGGCIANDVHGKNHHNEGSFGEHVTRITLLQGRTKVTASPARNKALFGATMGGLGQTGVILSARIRLKPCPGEAMEVRERRAENWDEFIAALDGSTASYCVGWIDALARGATLGRGIVEEAELCAAPVKAAGKSRSVPMTLPRIAMATPLVRAFNTAYYHRIPRDGREVIRRIDDFFFPLDRILGVNRLYGKQGFYQFQNVVPLDGAPALREMLERISRSHLASPLAVLKRMGPGRAGPMSFPMEGYTLAVDFQKSDPAERLIRELGAMTQAAGGRLYLAKDALATGEDIRAMYPDWKDWAQVVEKADPEHFFETDLTRRLGLRRAR